MAFRNSINRVTGIQISGEVDSSVDYGLVPNGTWFVDKSTGKIMYKPSDGGTPFEFKPIKLGGIGRFVEVDPINGIDAPLATNEAKRFKTLDYMKTQINNSGYCVLLHAGDHGASGSTFTMNLLNIRFLALGNTPQQVTRILGTTNVSSASSSVGFSGIAFEDLSVTGNCNFYLNSCVVSKSTGGTFTKTGSGYLEVIGSSLDGSTTTFITGAGQGVFQGCKIGVYAQSNSLSIIEIKNGISIVQPNIALGTFVMTDTRAYSLGGTTNAAISSAGTTFVANNSSFITPPSGTVAPVGLSGYWSINGSSIASNSTLNSSLNLGTISNFDALKTLGSIVAEGSVTAKAIRSQWVQTNSYLAGDCVVNLDSTDSKYYWWRAKSNIASGTAWNASLWDKLAGSGGGSTYTLIKKYPEAILDTATYPAYQTDGKSYIFTNVANLNTSYYPISDGTTPQEGDVYLYNISTGQYSRDLAVSTITTNGDYLINITSENETYSYYSTDKWKKFLTTTAQKFKAKGDVVKHFAGNFLQPIDAGVRLVEQVKLAQTSTAGNYGYTEVSFDKVQIVQDGARSLFFRRHNVSNNYGFYGHTTSAGTITPLATAYTNVFNGIAAEAKSFALLQNDYLAHVVLVGGGANRIDVIPQSWNAGTGTYTTGTTLNVVASGVLSMRATLNANNVLVIQYTTSGGLYEIAVLCAGATLSKGTATLITATIPQYYNVFSGGVGGRYMYVYSTDSVVFNYIIYDVTTGFVRSQQTTVAVVNGLVQPNNNEIHSISKDGEVILHWKRPNFGTYVKIFNVQTNVLNETTLISDSQLTIRLSYGANSGIGCAVGIFPEDSKPRVCGWVKSGNGISLAEPSVTTGTYQNISIGSDFGIAWTGSQFISAYAGQVSGGISPQTNPVYAELTLSTVTQLAEVIPDCIIEETAPDGSIVRVSMDQDISGGHTGIVVGQVYYLLGGRITTIDTGIQIGVGISDTEIKVFLDFNNNNERINNLVTSFAQLSSTSAGHENRISTLESRYNTYAFPKYQKGFGLHVIKNGIDVMNGSYTQYRVMGQSSRGQDMPTPCMNRTNGINIVSYEQHQTNIGWSVKIGRDSDGTGYLFICGYNNDWGQWADGTTTATANRGNGDFVMITNSEIFGGHKSVLSVYICQQTWGNDSFRPTIVCDIFDPSDSTYKTYAWGYASDATTDTWRLYPNLDTALTSNFSTSPVLVRNSRL
ncbi:MAG: hypothetical protein VKN72_11855, partial [Nostocales cyanobacterium 94392]|nr:hypothetical protein [Nostocales cyanobacterium 94392]